MREIVREALEAGAVGFSTGRTDNHLSADGKMTPASEASMQQLRRAQGDGHIWFVGAYSRYSMPLLENGVTSAMEVARALHVDTSDVQVDTDALSAAAAANEARRHQLRCMLLFATAAVVVALFARQ